MPSNDKGSSYDRVYELLAATPEAIAIKDRIKRHLESLTITGWTFSLREVHDVPTAFAHFQVNLLDYKFGLDYCEIPIYRMVPSSEIDDVVLQHFGKDVPTFFCRKSSVLEGCSSQRGRKECKSFTSWFRDRIASDLSELNNSTRIRLLADATNISLSREFTQEKTEALLRFCNAEIVGVMKKYSFLGEDALRGAIQEFVADDVMGS